MIIYGDCLKIFPTLESESIDMVLTDIPYGTTACKWDVIIPFEPMWEQLKRIVKPNAAIVFTVSQPFSSMLVMSNLKMFRYEWIWEKNRGSNFLVAKYQPMKEHELLLVFSKEKPTYNPIYEPRKGMGSDRVKYTFNSSNTDKRDAYGGFIETKKPHRKKMRLPGSVRKYNTEVGYHPTQKPVALMKYLIKTYTKEGDTVLDFCIGSGTTGVACNMLNRKFIGIELDEKYFKVANERIAFTQRKLFVE